MKEKGRGKELKLELFDNYNVIVGTVDNKNTVAVYLRVSAWAEPLYWDSETNYIQVIKKLNKMVRSQIYKKLDADHFHKDLTIMDLDLRESGIVDEKRSFMSCELTLFQTGRHQVNSEFMLHELEDTARMLVTDVFEKNEAFRFHLRKK